MVKSKKNGIKKSMNNRGSENRYSGLSIRFPSKYRVLINEFAAEQNLKCGAFVRKIILDYIENNVESVKGSRSLEEG